MLYLQEVFNENHPYPIVKMGTGFQQMIQQKSAQNAFVRANYGYLSELFEQLLRQLLPSDGGSTVTVDFLAIP